MALPSRPNARLGLPTNPRSRSMTAGGTRTEVPPRPSSAASDRPRTRTTSSPSSPPRQLRAQRSAVDLTRSTSRAGSSSDYRSLRDAVPPVPPLPSLRTRTNEPFGYRPARHGSVESVGTSSSGSSSNTGLGYASSATSIEDFEDAEKEQAAQKVSPGFGSSLWSRVAGVASNLTISVSKAWETNVATYSGEETPPGQESRITRALKAYHIAKAQSPSDLPEWLFDERDRGVTSRVRTSDDIEESDSQLPPPQQQPKQPQPFRVKDIAIPSQTDAMRSSRRAAAFEDPAPSMSRAAQRLKEMAEAKRNPKVKFADGVNPRRPGTSSSGGGADSTKAFPDLPRPAERMGEPSVQRSAPPLPKVDLRGKQLSSRGLPSGVRPQRR